MKVSKTTIKNRLAVILPTLLLVIGILLAFWKFIQDNNERIARQNEEYIGELTVQRAISIDNLIAENMTFIRSTAYLYGRNLTSAFADVAVIREYEANTAFDRLCFVDASGDDYTSRGVMANLADREYFQAGMRGESGTVFVPVSRVTNQKQIGFYAPVSFEGEVVGVMVGFYGEEYIRQLLEYQLFGCEGEGWLCLPEGTVIGSTVDGEYESYFDYLAEDGRCDAEEQERLMAAFAAVEDASFTYREKGDETSGSAIGLREADWILVRSFPASAAREILRNANREGETLILALVGLFFAYTVLRAVSVALTQRRMRKANQDANDVSNGVAQLFEKFIKVDLREATYAYVGGEPFEADFPREGPYAQFCAMLAARIPEEKHREEIEAVLEPENLRRALTGADRFSQRVHAPGGGKEWFTFSFTVLEREEKEPTRLLIVCQDVTALREKEEEEQRRLQEALDAAEHASKAKTEFLFNMSHDIRTPMNAIIGYTELAQHEGVSREEILDYVQKIDSSSKHLLALINDILEMSRIESGKMTLEPEPMDLLQAMTEVKELFTTQMTGKNIRFTVDSSGVKDRWVSCDKNRLDRILLNLLSNAYKFTGEGGTVAVTLRQTGGTAERGSYELRVKDNGIGMSKEFAEKLFNAFERERTSTVSGIQGTGLGLSITRSIVDLMGGSIEAVTEQGKGTEFIVRLRFPLAQGAQAEPTAEALAAPTLDFSKLRLLLVEDNMINREIATLILTQAGFPLETAENGRIAVDMVAASQPGYYAAVLMDVQMPVMDGYTATRAIRALPDAALASIPIIAMTANAFQEDVQAARDAGMNSHIAKPLDVEKMLGTLTEVLSR